MEFNDLSVAGRRPRGINIPNQMALIVEALESGAVKVNMSIGSNVMSSLADTNQVYAALAKADLVVSQDIFPSQFSRASVVLDLPGRIWLEKIGAKSTNTHLHLSDRVLLAAARARPVDGSFAFTHRTIAQEGADGLVLAQARTFAHFRSFDEHARALPSLADQ